MRVGGWATHRTPFERPRVREVLRGRLLEETHPPRHRGKVLRGGERRAAGVGRGPTGRLRVGKGRGVRQLAGGRARPQVGDDSAGHLRVDSREPAAREVEAVVHDGGVKGGEGRDELPRVVVGGAEDGEESGWRRRMAAGAGAGGAGAGWNQATSSRRGEGGVGLRAGARAVRGPEAGAEDLRDAGGPAEGGGGAQAGLEARALRGGVDAALRPGGGGGGGG